MSTSVETIGYYQQLPDEEIANRRLRLALIEIGACVSDLGNILLQGKSAPKLKLGGIVMGLQRAMLAVQNKSFAEQFRDPNLQATDDGTNHVYMDPVIELVNLTAEFAEQFDNDTPLKRILIEMLESFDLSTQVEIKQIDGIAIRSQRVCTFVYKNYKGEVEKRIVRPTKFYFGTTDWYPNYGPLMEGLDMEKNAMRIFSTLNMTEVVFS